MNMTVSDLGFGLKARRALPEGLILLSVPFDGVPTLLQNLEKMESYPHWYDIGRDGYLKGIMELSDERKRKFPDKMNLS